MEKKSIIKTLLLLIFCGCLENVKIHWFFTSYIFFNNAFNNDILSPKDLTYTQVPLNLNSSTNHFQLQDYYHFKYGNKIIELCPSCTVFLDVHR